MAEALLIDGRDDAEDLRDAVGKRVREIRDTRKLRPGIALIRVGDKGETKVMLDEREAWARDVGFTVNRHDMPAETTTDELLLVIEGMNDDTAINGVLLLEPLPRHIDLPRVRRAIQAEKDVDGQHPRNMGEMITGGTGLLPSIPLAVRHILRHQHGRDLAGMTAAVIGRCAVVGSPVAQLLTLADCTVTLIHSRSRDPKAVTRQADIVVSSINRPEAIRADWIRPGATVIDTGRHRVQRPDGNVEQVGDCRRADMLQVAGAYADRFTAVGPLGIGMLLRNTLLACCRQHRLDMKLADCGV
ncbi:bifunctional 5,10-methylenetetrahydrofolate dehydrogenase/5,10-methenyltetrahydrofolate cyclohydrolase [Caenispirillum bisanense]|uniref:bifunctional 5,10-methylenetetrahydrofolate dehydrogenase/5,10-methenyltetrahydrofolate cyclohydrolase n=1 Tax=Caenispirillum bisanense TaxID=414052 RepID=UPI0031D5F242